MKIAICDDIKKDAELLKQIVCSKKEYSGSTIELYSDGVSLVAKMRSGQKYDVLFLDVSMPEINGIDIGKAVRTIDPDIYIIFTTNYTEFAIEAYDCHPFHYFVKPLKQEKIIEALNLIETEMRKKHAVFSAKTKSGYLNLPINEINYIECCKRHLIFHMEDKTYEIPGKISDAEERLKEYDFCRVHQGYIVNMRKILSIDKLTIEFGNGDSVPVSQRLKSGVILRYAKFLGDNRI